MGYGAKARKHCIAGHQTMPSGMVKTAPSQREGRRGDDNGDRPGRKQHEKAFGSLQTPSCQIPSTAWRNDEVITVGPKLGKKISDHPTRASRRPKLDDNSRTGASKRRPPKSPLRAVDSMHCKRRFGPKGLLLSDYIWHHFPKPIPRKHQ